MSEATKLHGSCLVCGFDKPYAVWHGPSESGVVVGACLECRNAGQALRRMVPDPATEHKPTTAAQPLRPKTIQELLTEAVTVIRVQCTAIEDRYNVDDAVERSLRSLDCAANNVSFAIADIDRLTAERDAAVKACRMWWRYAMVPWVDAQENVSRADLVRAMRVALQLNGVDLKGVNLQAAPPSPAAEKETESVNVSQPGPDDDGWTTILGEYEPGRDRLEARVEEDGTLAYRYARGRERVGRGYLSPERATALAVWWLSRPENRTAALRLTTELAAERAGAAVMLELLTRKSFGQSKPDVVEALRRTADAVRAHSGFDPGVAYDQLAADIERFLAVATPAGTSLLAEMTALRERVETAEKGAAAARDVLRQLVEDVDNLISQSDGVAGLHLETGLRSLDDARAVVGAGSAPQAPAKGE